MKTKKTAVEKLTIGLDLGDRRHHACVLDPAGEILAEEVIANTREVVSAFAARYPGATFVMAGKGRDSHGYPPLHITSNSEGLTLRSPARGTSVTLSERKDMSDASEMMHQVGAFEPHEAKRVLALFEERKIPFEVEADHSALADPTRPLQFYFGMYPEGSKLAVFVLESNLEEAARTLSELFPI